jgi:lipopolysaccharide biosynthesis glycosyltransferase
MIKLYELRNKINNLTEFNFYFLKDSVKYMKNFHPKGEACPGKFELPELLPNDVKRLIIFDAGDVIVLRDLSELYNYNMNGYWALGPPEPTCIYKNCKTF